VSSLVAQAKGADDTASLRRSMRQGFWMTLMLAAVLIPLFANVDSIFRLLGQSEDVVRLSADYARIGAWIFLPALAIVVFRALLAAYDDTWVIFFIMTAGIVVNAACNYALMFGNWGFPRLELTGSAISTLLVEILMVLALLAYTLTRPRYRQLSLFVRFWRPDWPRFWRILRLGLPVGLLFTAEVGLFSIAALFMGWLGTSELAAHAIALQMAAISFMVPMGISQAATVRVGLAYGARDRDRVGKAGWVAILAGTGFMGLTAVLFFVMPHALIGLFLDPALPQNGTPIALAVSFLGIAAMFQLVDGAQVVSAAVLRGINDTTAPMLVAIFGYWGVGLTLAYSLAFVFELRGVGVWIGLAAGLAVVAVTLTTRFALRERLALV
jgi:MATE family multidrug resistance protein